VGEGFGETGLLHIVAELRIDAGSVFLMPCCNRFRDCAQRIEMAGRVTIAPRVICDDRLSVLEQIDEWLVHV
jgi:hypothetical protein